MIWLLAAHAQTFGFTEGAEPLDVRWASAASCGDCHEEQAEDWAGSRHRVAHTNPLYELGLVDEPSAFCVNCHSPVAAQAREVMADLAWYRWRRAGEVGPEPARVPSPRAEEGVTCVACHVRDGAVLSTTDAPFATHRVQVAPIDDAAFCAGCHEFRMPAFTAGTWTLTDVPMQSTYAEWKAWGGPSSCVDCHMPGGRHVFRGAHDRAFLTGALDARPAGSGDARVLELRSVDVGHAFPTGDLFRNLTVEVLDGGTWTTLHRIGRRFDVEDDDTGLAVHKRVVEDTSLQPGEVRRVAIGDRAWRVRFHYGSERDEHRGALGDDVLYAVLASGD